MDKYEQLMNIYNNNCDGYSIATTNIADKEELNEEEYSLSISGTLAKNLKTYIFVCSYYPDGYGKAEVKITIMEKGKGCIVDKTIKVEDTIEH